MIWSLIVGALIGVIAGAITSRGAAMGWISNILAGLIGSWQVKAIRGLGSQSRGHGLIPSIIGAVILVLIVSWVTTRMNKQQSNINYGIRRLVIDVFYFSYLLWYN